MTSEERSNIINSLVDTIEDWSVESLIYYAKINSRIALINMNDDQLEIEWKETFGKEVIH